MIILIMASFDTANYVFPVNLDGKVLKAEM